MDFWGFGFWGWMERDGEVSHFPTRCSSPRTESSPLRRCWSRVWSRGRPRFPVVPGTRGPRPGTTGMRESNSARVAGNELKRGDPAALETHLELRAFLRRERLVSGRVPGAAWGIAQAQALRRRCRARKHRAGFYGQCARRCKAGGFFLPDCRQQNGKASDRAP